MRILRRPLKIVFIGEEGVDEGGLVKDYFQVILPYIYQQAFAPIDAQHTVCV